MTARTVAAIDLGAESGRVTAVGFDGCRLTLKVVNRFANTPHQVDGLLRWNIAELWSGVRSGLAELAAGDDPVASVGVDTWGVDYGLFDAAGDLVDDPTCYRDQRGTAAMTSALATVGPQRMYSASGVQIMPINSVFSLYSDARDYPERLARAHCLQMMPDVFHRMLSGTAVSEYTAVSTTAAYDMQQKRWATELLDELGIPTSVLPEVVDPGTDVGALLGELATGALAGARTIVPAAHDTASAVVAVPYADPGALFLSSGTWSLLGSEVDQAIVSEASRQANLTNEGGYQGTIRLLRNVMGLWILQQCRQQWARAGMDLSYAEIAELAAAEPLLRTVIAVDDEVFLAPGDMPSRIAGWAARSGQPIPESVGAIARCVVDSLALSYRSVVDDLATVTGSRAPSITVVGGGVNHAGLAQATADATGLTVHCGPVEATALGNAAVQLAALGELGGPAEIRQIIAAEAVPITYQPRGDDRWDEAAELLGRWKIEQRASADHDGGSR